MSKEGETEQPLPERWSAQAKVGELTMRLELAEVLLEKS